MNMGAYFHVAPRLKTCMLEEGRSSHHQMPYAGRPPCASTATGFGKVSAPVCCRKFYLSAEPLLCAMLCRHMRTVVSYWDGEAACSDACHTEQTYTCCSLS